MEDDRRSLGAEGETRAAAFLARRGYRIIERNIRVAGVEVDLIVRRGTTVAFVEVKTRRGEVLGGPELAVDEAKQARLIRAAAGWLRDHPGEARRFRFDVVTCRAPLDPLGEWQIDHWVGAFDANG